VGLALSGTSARRWHATVRGIGREQAASVCGCASDGNDGWGETVEEGLGGREGRYKTGRDATRRDGG
jgi:hypothetical protein